MASITFETGFPPTAWGASSTWTDAHWESYWRYAATIVADDQLGKLTSIDTNLATIKSDLAAIKGSQATVATKIAAIDTAMSGLKGNSDTVAAKIASIDTALGTLAENSPTDTAALGALQTAVEELVSQGAAESVEKDAVMESLMPAEEWAAYQAKLQEV